MSTPIRTEQPGNVRRRHVRRWIVVTAAISLAAATVGWWFIRTEGPIRPVTLDPPFFLQIFGRSWRDLPFRLSADEEADLKRCDEMPVLYRSSSNGVSPFLDDSVRSDLEEMVARRPDFFYAEYLLSLWHERHGDSANADRYRTAAREHAPVVLVQPFVLPDGSPVRNTNVSEMQIECNRVQNGSLNPDLKLTFLNLTTDDEGCVYLPVYDTVYRVYARSHPDGYEPDFPKLGWFKSPRRFGVLPVVTLRPKANDHRALR